MNLNVKFGIWINASPQSLLYVSLRNRTWEQRRRQTLCDKRDNNFVWKKICLKFHCPFNRSFCKRPENINYKWRLRQNMQVIAPSHKRFAVLFRISWDRVKKGGSFMVTEKIEKAPNSIHITIQHPTNNSFRNINKHPEWLSRTKFKSPFKKIIQTRYFSRFQSIEFHLAHERYVVWTASLSRRFANRKYRVILCLFVTHSSRHSKFSYVWKNGKDIMLEDTQRT